MFLDWLLASFHHLAVFSLAGILAVELALTASVIDDRTMLRLARIDAWFGLVAAIVVGAGLMRIFFAAKGFDYYKNKAIAAWFGPTTRTPCTRVLACSRSPTAWAVTRPARSPARS